MTSDPRVGEATSSGEPRITGGNREGGSTGDSDLPVGAGALPSRSPLKHCFWVKGLPRPQGSNFQPMRGRVVVDDFDLDRWRGNVRRDAGAYWDLPPLEGPVRVRLTFWLPLTDRRRKWIAYVDDDGVPVWSAAEVGRMDIEKLTRAVFDPLTWAKVWRDDGLVDELEVVKLYADPPKYRPGVLVELEPK